MALIIKQSTEIYYKDNKNIPLDELSHSLSLFDAMIHDIKQDIKNNLIHNDDILTSIYILVPNLTIAAWLKNKLAEEFGICCNFKFLLLNNFFLELSNNHKLNNIFTTIDTNTSTDTNAIYENRTNKNNQLLQIEDFTFIIYYYLVQLAEGYQNNNNDNCNYEEFSLIFNYIFTIQDEDNLETILLSSNSMQSNAVLLDKQETKARNTTINNNTQLDYYKLFQLSHELSKIFEDYMYFRTMDLLVNDHFMQSWPLWQQLVWQYLLNNIPDNYITFLDLYQTVIYSINKNKEALNTQYNNKIYIFSINTMFQSQLFLLESLATIVDIKWYYLTISNQYYGDLLSTYARQYLEQKILKEPELRLDDLYLIDGNVLCANLAQQSRQFYELLLSRNLYPQNLSDFYAVITDNNANNDTETNTDILVDYLYSNDDQLSLLKLIQCDIKNLIKRSVISNTNNTENNINYNIGTNNTYQYAIDSEYYKSGFNYLEHATIINKYINDDSIRIEVCVSKIQEIEILFNNIVEIITKRSKCIDSKSIITLDDIIVLAPDITQYQEYIRAIFDNKKIRINRQDELFLDYTIIGNNSYSNHSIVTLCNILFNTPYLLSASVFFDIINNPFIINNLNLSIEDIKTIELWLNNNVVKFAYNQEDCNIYKYQNFDSHTFDRFLKNLTLGFFIPEQETFESCTQRLPIIDSLDLSIEKSFYTPYDNIEFANISLYNKINKLILILNQIRQLVYTMQTKLKTFSFSEVIDILVLIHDQLITQDEDSKELKQLIHYIQNLNNFNVNINQNIQLNLSILNNFFNKYLNNKNHNTVFNGKIIFTSIAAAKNLPFKVIYILGLNFLDFPRKHNINLMNMINKRWYIADRNLNLEDRQIFLELILAAKEYLIFSYIGRSQYDLEEYKPATVLSLLIDVIDDMFNLNLSNKPDNITETVTENIAENAMSYKAYMSEYITKVNTLFTHVKYYYNLNENKDKDHADNHHCHDNSNSSLLDISNKIFNNNKNYYDYIDQLMHTIQSFNDIANGSRQIVSNNLNVSINEIFDTFLYTNNNLYKTLKIHLNELLIYKTHFNDFENIQLYDKKINNNIFTQLEQIKSKYSMNSLIEFFKDKTLYTYLQNKSLLSYGTIGETQFDHYMKLYIFSQEFRALTPLTIKLKYLQNKHYQINLEDEIYINQNNEVIFLIYDDIKTPEKNYHLQIKCLIYLIMLEKMQQDLSQNNNPNLSENSVKIIIINDNSIINNYTAVLHYIVNFENNHEFSSELAFASNIDELFNLLLEFFIYSINNPVLIHKMAILTYRDEFHKKIKKLKKHTNNDNFLLDYSEALEIHKIVKQDSIAQFYNNMFKDALLNLNIDIFYKHFTNNYFDKVLDTDNTIYKIAQLLLHLKIY